MAVLRKIILTADINLTVEDPFAGKNGKILVKQDSVGFHVVHLPAGSFGNITVEPTPGKTTLLEYLVDDTGVYWTSEILTPADVINNPGTITNLVWNFIDAESVQIQFTAPSGNGTRADVLAERYVIYYSNAPIDETINLDHLQTYKQTFIPQAKGQTEIFNLAKLTPNQIYYITVVAQKTTYGKTKSGAISNVINFLTLPLEGGGADGTLDIMIPIKAENISFVNVLFVEDTDGVTLGPDFLVEYENITYVGGVPVGVASRNMLMMHTNQYKAGYYNQEMAFYFDLEFIYTVNKVFLNVVAGSDDKNVYTSLDGANWVLAGIIDGTAAKNKWYECELDDTHNTNVRYIKITTSYTAASWAGIMFTGRRQSVQNIAGQKYKNSIVPLTLPQKIGTNSNIVNDQAFTATVASLVRLYSNHVWYTDDVPKYKAGAGAAGLVTLANIEYKFINSNVGNSDDYFKGCHDNNLDIMFCMVGMPYFLHPDPTADAEHAKRRKPLDLGLDMTLENTTNPLNYKFIAQFYWQVAARYGNTGGQSNTLFRISPSDTIKKGLGYVKYFELGLNEPTGASQSSDAYTNPEELAAIISACYDGHMGAMGPGFGIKNADPTAIPVSVGLTAVPLGYKLAMFRWWDAHRGLGNYPVKILTEHYYNITGGPPIQENVYARVGLFSLPPERGYFQKFILEHVEVRNRTPLLQGVEFWITETGYDEHLGSFFSPKDPSISVRGWKKALWIIRIFMMMDYWGLDRTLQYAIFSFKYLNQLSNAGNGDIWQSFATSGYLDGPNSTTAPDRVKMQAYYYSTAFQKALTGYKFSHAVRAYGTQLTNEVITKNTDADLFVFAYVPLNTSLLPMLILWLGNDQITRTVNIETYVNSSETNVPVLSFDDLHTSHLEVGTPSVVASVAEDPNKKLIVAVTATPKIIYTINIGTGKLIDPDKIIIQAITTTQIKLAWRDRNLGVNKTKIYRSTDPATGFVQIFFDYIDNGSYIDNALAENTVYYYRIQFERDGLLSGTSTSYGIQTPRTIPVPGTFAKTGQTPASISLAWTYNSGDAAYIDGFELWRSTAAAGTYVKVTNLPAATRAYTDNGLVSNTTYYYKLRGFKGSALGNYTAVVSSTTDAASILPPALVSAETSYSGDRITLLFNLPISDPSGQNAFFTIVEQTGSRYINVLSVALNPTNANKVNLYLESAVLSTGKTLSFSYDGINGTLSSIYGVKANSITNQAIVNRLNDPTLLVKLMKFNLSTDATPSGLSDWNDFSLSGRSYNAVQLVKNVNNDGGVATGYKFTVNEKNPQSHFQNILDVSATPGSYFATGDAVNGLFPIAVRTIGADTNNGASSANKIIMALMKLDNTKVYNVKVYCWKYPSAPLSQTAVQGNGAGIIKTVMQSANTDKIVYITNLVPSNIALPAVSASPDTDGYNSDKITIHVYAPATGGTATVQALIIEEVINN